MTCNSRQVSPDQEENIEAIIPTLSDNLYNKEFFGKNIHDHILNMGPTLISSFFGTNSENSKMLNPETPNNR